MTKPRRVLRARTALAGAAFVLAISLPVRAQETAATNGDGWSFALTPYIWFASLKGEVATISGLPAVSVDAGFDDIIENADFAFIVAGEARRGRFGIIIDLNYLSLSTDGGTLAPCSMAPRLRSGPSSPTSAGSTEPWPGPGQRQCPRRPDLVRQHRT
jgi:hypothetical protein